jgi:hypothetical protein
MSHTEPGEISNPAATSMKNNCLFSIDRTGEDGLSKYVISILTIYMKNVKMLGRISARFHFLGSVRLFLTENPQVPNRPIFQEDVSSCSILQTIAGYEQDDGGNWRARACSRYLPGGMP